MIDDRRVDAGLERDRDRRGAEREREREATGGPPVGAPSGPRRACPISLGAAACTAP